MSINIPDRLPKLFVLIGIIIFSIGYYNGEISDKEYLDKVDEFNELIELNMKEIYELLEENFSQIKEIE